MNTCKALLILIVLTLAWSCTPIMVSEKGVAFTTKEADVFLGPNWDQTYFTTLKPETRLTLLGMQRDWYRIQLPGGGIAWIHKSSVRIIPYGNCFTLKKARIRKGPGTNTKIIAVVYAGTQLTNLGQYGEWYQVALKDGRTGWIHRSLVAAK